MSKKQAAEAAAEQAETRALIAEQDARHATIEAQDRIERERMLQEFRNEMTRSHREFMPSIVQAETTVPSVPAETSPPVTPPPPRGPDGRWLPAAPPAEPEPVDAQAIASMSPSQYASWRSANGIGGYGEQNLSRRPGVTQASGQGMFDGLPGYVDPRQANKTVFRSTLEDNRKPVPPGYQRSAAGEQQQHDEWR